MFFLVCRLKELSLCQDARAHLTHARVHLRISQQGACAHTLDISVTVSESTPRMYLCSIAHHMRSNAPL
jgi:hypothetical protein